jgi:hypothetical protein
MAYVFSYTFWLITRAAGRSVSDSVGCFIAICRALNLSVLSSYAQSGGQRSTSVHSPASILWPFVSALDAVNSKQRCLTVTCWPGAFASSGFYLQEKENVSRKTHWYIHWTLKGCGRTFGSLESKWRPGNNGTIFHQSLGLTASS